MTDFKDHPTSLAEIKADRADDGSLWTPRDVLMSVLRRLDSEDIRPDVLVVTWSEIEDGKRHAHFSQSTPDGLSSLGLMQATIFKMQE